MFLLKIFLIFVITSLTKGTIQGSTTCVLPPYPSHGSYTVLGDPTAKPGKVLPGAVLNTACDDGYELTGSKDTICFNGIWSGTVASCVAKTPTVTTESVDQTKDDSSLTQACVIPDRPSHGSFLVYTKGIVQYQLGTDPKSLVLLNSCDPGYQLSGSEYIVCYNGVWSGEVPKCLPNTALCILPQLPAHGRYTVLGERFAAPGQAFDHVALNVTCNPGYKMFGKSDLNVVCNNGQWTTEVTDCVLTLEPCILPQYPAHGSYIVADNPKATPGQSIVGRVTLSITCETYYDAIGDKELTCYDGVWSGSVPDCQDLSDLCRVPPNPDHGRFQVVGKPKAKVNQAFDSFLLNVTCDTGYKMSGKSNLYVMCNNGNWSEETANCEPTLDCILPPYPAQGHYDVDGRPEAAPGLALNAVSLKITCEPGYKIVGDPTRFCYNGVWSDKMVDCEVSTSKCVLPPYPANGKYVVAGRPNAGPGKAFESVALRITCDYGYDISGPKERTCTLGKWSEMVTDCVPNTELCVLPQYPTFGGYKVIGKPKAVPDQAYDTVALQIFCNPGYRYPKFDQVICLNGSWIYTNTKCVYSDHLCIQRPFTDGTYKATTPPEPEPGEISVVSFSYDCNLSFKVGVVHICFEKHSTKAIVDCVPIAEPGLLPYTDVSTLERPEGREAPQEGREALQEDSKPCSLDKDPSVNYRCLISETSWDTRECKASEPSGTVVTPECTPHHYSPAALNPMRCVDGKWDYIAHCESECGIPTLSEDRTDDNLIGGKAAKKGEVPWHAGIYAKDGDRRKQICGGSIVSTKLVISAGHCFLNKDAKKEPATSYAVGVGKLYRDWNDDRDDAQKFDVSELVISPRFLGAIANFQEDIALVFLQGSIVYKKHVKPVCLDFGIRLEEEQLVQGKLGKVAGWGLTGENGKSAYFLQVGTMPYVPIERCQADAPPDFLRYITGDKICAGYLGGKAVCKGDSGGGLSFPDNPTAPGARPRYYLRGVVSTAPNNGTRCNPNWYTTYTQITKHERFINTNIMERM